MHEKLTIGHAKARLLEGPLTKQEDPEIWAEIINGQDHLAKWFGEIGTELVVHPDYGIALVRQMAEHERSRRAQTTGIAPLPPVLKSRALSYLESQVLTYLHEKLNSAASMGVHDLVLPRTEIHEAIVNLQSKAQRNRQATLITRIDRALNKFRDYGLLDEVDIASRPAIQPNLVLLVMVPRDELARFSALVTSVLDAAEDGGEPATTAMD